MHRPTLRFRFFSDAPPAVIPEREASEDLSPEARLERAHQAWLAARARLDELESTRDLAELVKDQDAENDAA